MNLFLNFWIACILFSAFLNLRVSSFINHGQNLRHEFRELSRSKTSSLSDSNVIEDYRETTLDFIKSKVIDTCALSFLAFVLISPDNALSITGEATENIHSNYAASIVATATQSHFTTFQLSKNTNTVKMEPVVVESKETAASVVTPKKTLTEDQIATAAKAFKAFDDKTLRYANRLFTEAIAVWDDPEYGRPRDEIVSLYKARGAVRVDLKDFDSALTDFDRAIALMDPDGVGDDGLGKYPEYPDAFAQRGLTYEGLGDWDKAVKDYSRAIDLWGGGRGDGINPFVLTFRGNAYTKLGKYDMAVDDYQAALDSFTRLRDDDRMADAGANLALALFEAGRTDESIKLMNRILRRTPGYTDLHVAIAVHAFAEGDIKTAETQWNVACNQISTGCSKYRDLNWIKTTRRWPPSLVKEYELFQKSLMF